MRKIILFVLAAVAIAITSGLQAQHELPHAPASIGQFEPTEAQIELMAKAIAKANPEIKDPRKIPIGYWMTVPTPAGDRYYQTVDWKLSKRERDCFYSFARSYLRGDLNDALVADTTKVVVANDTSKADSGVAAKVVTAKASSSLPWGWAILCILALLALAWLVLHYLRYGQLPRWMYGSRNPNHYQPVIAGGLSPNVDQAKNQLSVLAPIGFTGSKQIRTVEPGTLRDRRPTGDAEIIGGGNSGGLSVNMAFGDRKNRSVDLYDGERIHRVTYTDGTIAYFRSACANGFTSGPVSQGATLPRGWEFVADAAVPTPSNVVQVAPPVSSTVPTSELAGNSVSPDGNGKITFRRTSGVGPDAKVVTVEIEAPMYVLRRGINVPIQAFGEDLKDGSKSIQVMD